MWSWLGKAWDSVKGLFGGKGTLQIGKDNKAASSSTTSLDSPAISATGNVNYQVSTDNRKVTATHGSFAVGGNVNAPVTAFVINQAVAKAAGKAQIYTLPAPMPDKYFVGRGSETGKIRRILNAVKGGKAALTALNGMGGIGKSILAIYVANKVKNKFPDGQLFFPMNGIVEPVPSRDVLLCIIRSFEPDFEPTSEDIDALSAKYRSLLFGKKVLLVLDNVRDSAHVRPLLPPEGCGLIVTSRHYLDSLDGVEVLPLGEFTRDESTKLIRTLIPMKGTDLEIGTIAELCGDLPLALNVAGTFLKGHKNWSCLVYIEALRMERLKRLKLGDDKTKDVEAVLALSASQLVHYNPELASKWQELTVFKADFELKVATHVLGYPLELTTRDSLTSLQDRSLLLFDESNVRYRLHDLFRDIAEKAFDWGEMHDLARSSEQRLRDARDRYTAYCTDLLSRTVELLRSENFGSSTTMNAELFNLKTGVLQAAQGVQHLEDGDASKHKTTNTLVDFLSVGISKLAKLQGAELAKLITTHPEMAPTLLNMADMFAQSGRCQNAIELAEGVLKALPNKDDSFAIEVAEKVALWKGLK
jgi:hypothetical protein